MLKKCNRCGGDMTIMLRNVVYRRKVKIQNVPIHVCLDDDRAHSQVVEIIKEDLKELMDDLGDEPVKQDINFGQISEFSNLLVMVADHHEDTALKVVIEDRINELLDLFLLARSLGDQNWMGEIRRRLTQFV